jgi:hypothetical protein
VEISKSDVNKRLPPGHLRNNKSKPSSGRNLNIKGVIAPKSGIPPLGNSAANVITNSL